MGNSVLTQFIDQVGDDPTQVTDQSENVQVEPLGGPINLDELMERFPETVYDKSRDTHLFHFITALCGDAGVGLIKKQSYIARLKTEGELLQFNDLDNFYSQNFRFRRLKSEIYDEDPDVDILTAVQWDEIEQKDNSYKHRIKRFFQGIRLGNSPEGIATIAEAATGIHVETVENFKAIFDTYSDDVLNILVQGQTASPHEFILTPRVVENGITNTDVAYTRTLSKVYDPIGNTTTWDHVTAVPALNPDIERNMIDLLDRLRPVGTLMTIHNTDVHFKLIPVTNVAGSSEDVFLSRFVTGNQAVNWPDTSTTAGTFIVGGVEKESTHFPLGARPLPTIYQTIGNAIAYTDLAISDPTYNTPDFFTAVNGIAPFQKYKSEHVGQYYPHISNIYPFLKFTPGGIVFSADKALAAQNTPLVIEGRTI